MSSPLYKQLGMGGAGSPVTANHLLLLVLGAGFLAFTVFVVHPNDFRLQSFFSGGGTGCPGSQTDPLAAAPNTVLNHADATTPAPEEQPGGARVLIGIQTMPAKYERRNLLRTVYSLQLRDHPSLATAVDVRFVLCNVTNPVDAVLVSLEAIRYDDVIVLDCAENMDGGKTYDFFSTAARAFPNGTYDYVMKADDDIFLRLPELAASLGAMPRQDAYYGATIPCDAMDTTRRGWYMSGMGYALSWDLVEWIAGAENVTRGRTVGMEDRMTGEWLKSGGKGKNRFNAKPAMYDHPLSVPFTKCAHDLVPDTIAVHRLKDNPRWAHTLAYFNFTAGLQSSKFYKFDS